MKDINAFLQEYSATPGALLIDLRDEEDYLSGHIPGAKRISLMTIREDMEAMAGPDTPIFLYCYSGMRSFQAEAVLSAEGYTHVCSMGGVDQYTGELTEEEE